MGEETMTGKINDVVRKELMINASQRRAFQAFAEQMDLWWPRSYHIGKSEMKEVVLETKQGGRWYEVGVDSTECNWGKVLVWNPPHKLVLAWQITAEWQYDPNFLTEVEVNFVEKGPKLTSLTLEHRNIQKFGIKAQEIWSAFDSEGGWTGMLKSFATIAETEATAESSRTGASESSA
jgi:uncharacterized protein YndB with AHSA1/START domain